MSRQLRIRTNTIFELINELGQNCKSFVEVAEELKPCWSGYLLADAKTIFVKKEKFYLLLTADALTQDIPMATFSFSEDYPSYYELLKTLRDEIKFPLKGITTDGDPGLLKAVKAVFPDASSQLCTKHLDSYHRYYFNYLYQGNRDGIDLFLKLTSQLLFASDLWRLEYLLQAYFESRPYLQSVGLTKELEDFESKFKNFWVHLYHPGMPSTTNILEGIIRQLSRKINDTDGFNSPETAWNSLKLLIMNYRFKKFSCSHNGNNHKSPLKLAKVKTNNINWIQFSQKAT